MRIHLPRLLIVLLLAVSAGVVPAQTIYSWTDEDGITHFTDRKPDHSEDVHIQRAVARPEAMLEMHQGGTREDPLWLFRNRTHGPLAVRVWLEEAVNVVSYPDLPAVFVLPAAAERELVTIGALNPRQAWRYQIKSESLPGDPSASHRPNRPYRAPFARNQSFVIGQAFDGEFSHHTPDARYAVDIAMPVGTQIHAARAGKVMDIARWFHGSGTDLKRHGPRANFVRILHDDGSMAVYAHLDYEGVQVRPGDRVSRGQLIGRSGNTGFSTGPHLHFAIQVNQNMKLVSVPFEFEDADNGRQTPQRGMRLKASSD